MLLKVSLMVLGSITANRASTFSIDARSCSNVGVIFSSVSFRPPVCVIAIVLSSSRIGLLTLPAEIWITAPPSTAMPGFVSLAVESARSNFRYLLTIFIVTITVLLSLMSIDSIEPALRPAILISVSLVMP